MDDEVGWQSIARCNLCLAGFAATQSPALLQEFRPCRIVDRAVNFSATKQGTVGGIDYDIDTFPCNVTMLECNPGLHAVTFDTQLSRLLPPFFDTFRGP